MKTPEDFSIPEWTRYINEAFIRETGKKPNPLVHEILYPRLWGYVEKEIFDFFMLAIGLDLLALEDADEKELFEKTATSALIKPFFNRPRSRTFWRGVWFSRFAQTEHEINFYRHWLRQYEFAYNLEETSGLKDIIIYNCKKALQKAEEAILEDEPKAEFKLHWLKENMCDGS